MFSSSKVLFWGLGGFLSWIASKFGQNNCLAYNFLTLWLSTFYVKSFKMDLFGPAFWKVLWSGPQKIIWKQPPHITLFTKYEIPTLSELGEVRGTTDWPEKEKSIPFGVSWYSLWLDGGWFCGVAVIAVQSIKFFFFRLKIFFTWPGGPNFGTLLALVDSRHTLCENFTFLRPAVLELFTKEWKLELIRHKKRWVYKNACAMFQLKKISRLTKDGVATRPPCYLGGLGRKHIPG